jgi:hypothetical protein
VLLTACMSACQKEVSSELNNTSNNQTSDSLAANAIYVRLDIGGTLYYEDSLVFRFMADKTYEVHYNYEFSGDSSVKTYRFDNAGKLLEIDCPEGIFDASAISSGNTADATDMKFFYDGAGELARIDLIYSNHPPTSIYYNFSEQAGKYNAVIYDTSSVVIGRKISYLRLNSDRFIEQDSIIYIDEPTNFTLSYNNIYDNDNNVTQSVDRSYTNGSLESMSTTSLARYGVYNPYLALRERSFANLANWFPFTHYFAGQLNSALYPDQPKDLVKSYQQDQYVYLVTTDHYQYNHQSVIETENNKLKSRVSTVTLSGGGVGPAVLTERFYY